MTPRERLVQLYADAVAALSAERLSREACAGGTPPGPLQGGKVAVLGVGKVCAEMLDGVRAAGVTLSSATLAVPRGAEAERDRSPARLLPAAHPVPDQGSLDAGEALLSAASALGPGDGALLLVCGGGSALAEAPAKGISLADVRGVNEALLRSGAPIEEMNCIRAHLSRLKGGGGARALWSAGVRRALALALVDVPRGGAPAVSSGPFAPDPTTYADALAIVGDRRIALPRAAQAVLEAGGRGELPETLKAGDAAAAIEHRVLVDMRSPAQVAARLCAALDPRAQVAVWSEVVRGPLELVALRLEAELARPGPRFVVASGEPEVVVPAGAPAGGRAQHLALRLARALQGRDAVFLAAGTDGRDGATDAAGAAVDGESWRDAGWRQLDPAAALAGSAATPLLSQLGFAVPARRTGAHAGDLLVLWVR
ncbi:MAG: glycerate kinase [Myxococcales bacterium]